MDIKNYQGVCGESRMRGVILWIIRESVVIK